MKENENKNKKIIFMFVFIVLALCLLAGVTYAFFTTSVKNNSDGTDSVTVKGSKLELTYNDGNGLLEVNHLKPNTSVGSKTFTVTNTGKGKIDDYEVILSNVVNELEFYEDLTYTLNCTSNKGVCSGGSGYFPKNDKVLVTNSIDVGETQNYTLSIFYKETYEDQSNDLDKTITAKVNIQDETHIGE